MKEDIRSTVTKEVLRQLLETSISRAVNEAQREIDEPLPIDYYLVLEAFGQQGKELSLDEVLSFLFRNGTFPRIVDVAIRGIKDGRTLIWIRPSGHAYVGDFAQTWNAPVGMGPFKCIGLMLPQLIWQRPRPLSLQDLREAGENW
jgi:hypothetical protein